jgi:hypothetical protein
MIHELDAALRALVEREVLDGAEVEIEFDAPTKEWASRQNRPTVDIYLYDVRQDLSRRQFGRAEVLDDDGLVSARRRIPAFFRVAYLVTAWTQRPEDEHRLLSDLLACFLGHEIIPRELLQGSLEELGISIPLAIAMPPPQDRALSDVWSALGGELKPSLDLVAIAPILPEVYEETGPPVTREPTIDFGRTGAVPDAAERRGGRPMPPERVRGRVEEVGRPPPPLDDPAWVV